MRTRPGRSSLLKSRGTIAKRCLTTELSGRPRRACRKCAHHFLSALLRPTTFRGPLERVVRRTESFATWTNPRSASFTASEVGNAAATSGLRRTRLVPFEYAAWYLPRTPLPRSSRLYCFRMVEYRASALFVDSALGAGRAADADDSHNTSAFGVTYDEETTSLRKSKREEAALALGMIGVVEGDGQRITKMEDASSNVTLWSRRFEVAFFGSHANCIRSFYADVFSVRLTSALSGRPRCRSPHAEPDNSLLATRARPTIVHGPLRRGVRTRTYHASGEARSTARIDSRRSSRMYQEALLRFQR